MPHIEAKCRNCGRTFDTGIFLENVVNAKLGLFKCSFCEGVGDVITPRSAYDPTARNAIDSSPNLSENAGFQAMRDDAMAFAQGRDRASGAAPTPKSSEVNMKINDGKPGGSINIDNNLIKMILNDAVGFSYVNAASVQIGDGNLFLTFGLVDPTYALGLGVRSDAAIQSESYATVNSRVVLPPRVVANVVGSLLMGLNDIDSQAAVTLFKNLQNQLMEANNEQG